MKKNCSLITGVGREVLQICKLNKHTITDGVFKNGLKNGFIREIALFPPQYFIDGRMHKFQYIERGMYKNGKRNGEFLRQEYTGQVFKSVYQDGLKKLEKEELVFGPLKNLVFGVQKDQFFKEEKWWSNW